MKLMVSLMRQLQLIGIKTNLESFAITILMEHMLTRNQLPLFLWVSKQWGVGAASTNIMLPIPYTKVKFITLATSSMLNPSQGNISVAYHDSTLDNIRFQIRWQGLAAEYTGAWLTLGI